MDPLRKFQVCLRQWRYPGSRVYWEKRYTAGGRSGPGSSGVLAAYKAEVVNALVTEAGINSILELGCGDGQQLQLAQYPSYIGLDIAPSAVAICQALFAGDTSKRFAVYDPTGFDPAICKVDMALSMEVIFHLTEAEVYKWYMRHLFATARRWVVIFSSNTTDNTAGVFPHFKPRRFLEDIPTGWVLRQHLPNPHAAISVSEFFIFEKTSVEEKSQ